MFQENFERDVFLCDQAEQNLTFLSRFLETHIFSSFVDSKITGFFDTPPHNVAVFDNRIQEIKRNIAAEIKSPLISEGMDGVIMPNTRVRCGSSKFKTFHLSSLLL